MATGWQEVKWTGPARGPIRAYRRGPVQVAIELDPLLGIHMSVSANGRTDKELASARRLVTEHLVEASPRTRVNPYVRQLWMPHVAAGISAEQS